MNFGEMYPGRVAFRGPEQALGSYPWPATRRPVEPLGTFPPHAGEDPRPARIGEWPGVEPCYTKEVIPEHFQGPAKPATGASEQPLFTWPANLGRPIAQVGQPMHSFPGQPGQQPPLTPLVGYKASDTTPTLILPGGQPGQHSWADVSMQGVPEATTLASPLGVQTLNALNSMSARPATRDDDQVSLASTVPLDKVDEAWIPYMTGQRLLEQQGQAGPAARMAPMPTMASVPEEGQQGQDGGKGKGGVEQEYRSPHPHRSCPGRPAWPAPPRRAQIWLWWRPQRQRPASFIWASRIWPAGHGQRATGPVEAQVEFGQQGGPGSWLQVVAG